MNGRFIRTGIKLIAAALLATALFCVPAFAVTPLDPSFETELKIDFNMDGKPISDCQFYVHKVADWNGLVTFNRDTRYDAYGIIDPLAMTNNDDWLAAASTLSEKIKADGSAPAPIASGKTGSDGTVSFTGMKPGLYLIYSDWTRIGDYKYAAVPYFAILPEFDEDLHEWNDLFLTYPKRQKLPDLTKLNALKVWDDKGYESTRPKEVTIHLLKDGTVVDTRTLSASNNWKCTFENLSKDAVYTVTEDSVANYKTTIKQEGITFVITNTRTKPGPNPHHDPSGPGKIVTEEFEPEILLAKLPQTGLLWWPVMLMGIVGAALIIVGISTDKKKNVTEGKE